jgi:hypothetical protein
MKKILWETHIYEDVTSLLPLIRDYKTSREGHRILKRILMRKCEKATKIDCGLQIPTKWYPYISYCSGYQWLLQPELKAKQEGLSFGYRRFDVKRYRKVNYVGYLDENGRPHGVGIRELDGIEYAGEFHHGSCHGVGKYTNPGKGSYWGQYMDGFSYGNGYGTKKYKDGKVEYSHFKNGL